MIQEWIRTQATKYSILNYLQVGHVISVMITVAKILNMIKMYQGSQQVRSWYRQHLCYPHYLSRGG